MLWSMEYSNKISSTKFDQDYKSCLGGYQRLLPICWQSAYLSVKICRTSVGVSLQVSGPELESQYSMISLTWSEKYENSLSSRGS